MDFSLPAKRRNLAAAACAAGFLLILLALLLYPQTVSRAVASSITYCLSVLTPSLFPFMVLSSFAVHSSAAAFFGRPLGGLVRRAFRLPGTCAVPILMSFIGGYPAGARGVSLLLEKEQITREQAGRMLLFCVNPGLAFVVTFLGAGVLGSLRLGWLLFACVTLSGLLLGVITAFRAPAAKEPAPAPQEPTRGALIRSVSDSARSVVLMCACVVLFSGFTAILHSCGAYRALVSLLARARIFSPMEWAAVLSFLLEVTGGVGASAQLAVSPVFYAFGLAFGGICVHMQVFAFFQDPPVKLRTFLLCRLVHGLMAAGFFLLFCLILPRGEVPASASLGGAGGAAGFSGSFFGGASLLLMCMAFLLALGEKKARGPKGNSHFPRAF